MGFPHGFGRAATAPRSAFRFPARRNGFARGQVYRHAFCGDPRGRFPPRVHRDAIHAAPARLAPRIASGTHAHRRFLVGPSPNGCAASTNGRSPAAGGVGMSALDPPPAHQTALFGLRGIIVRRLRLDLYSIPPDVTGIFPRLFYQRWAAINQLLAPDRSLPATDPACVDFLVGRRKRRRYGGLIIESMLPASAPKKK